MLRRISLITSNACNLNCSYCYADKYNISSKNNIMSKNTAIQIIKHIHKYFGGAEQVFFFGGEPLLAIETIEEVCTFFEDLFNYDKIEKLPVFLIVTNGTLISNRFLNLARKYNFVITISLDGNQEIHDIHRKTRDGKGSFHKVMEGIDLIRSAGLSFSLECTHTLEHLKRGIFPIDIYNYFKELGAAEINITPVTILQGDRLKQTNELNKSLFPHYINLYANAINDVFSNKLLCLDGLGSMYKTIIEHPYFFKENFCGAGINTFCVNPDGLTYPCHMFNNHLKFCLGYYNKLKTMKGILPTKNSIEVCKKCSIKEVCLACPARMYILNQSDAIPVQSDCAIRIIIMSIVSYSLTGSNLLPLNDLPPVIVSPQELES